MATYPLRVYRFNRLSKTKTVAYGLKRREFKKMMNKALESLKSRNYRIPSVTGFCWLKEGYVIHHNLPEEELEARINGYFKSQLDIFNERKSYLQLADMSGSFGGYLFNEFIMFDICTYLGHSETVVLNPEIVTMRTQFP